MRDLKQKTTKNNCQMLQGICVVCGMKMSKFISASGKGCINESINSLPFEMHMPVHTFTGPGTKLNKRLNEDMTLKAWSKTINKVDKQLITMAFVMLKTKTQKHATMFVIEIG